MVPVLGSRRITQFEVEYLIGVFYPWLSPVFQNTEQYRRVEESQRIVQRSPPYIYRSSMNKPRFFPKKSKIKGSNFKTSKLSKNFISLIRYICKSSENCSFFVYKCQQAEITLFLAHLSRRLIGELIVYQWSVVRPSVRPSSTMLKDLLLRNRWADQSQILCGASLGRGNDIVRGIWVT